MDINQLCEAARSGDSVAEDHLFSELTVSFRLIAQRKVEDMERALELTQEALMTVAAKYKNIQFERSFAAWAHQVLTYKIMDYYKSRKVRQDYQAEMIAASNDIDPGSSDPMLKMGLLRCLEKLTSVNGRYARVLGMSTEGYSSTEICDEMKITKGNCLLPFIFL